MKRTSTEARVYMRRHQVAKVKHFDVSNVIYHKFSHGAVSNTLNGENVNGMLELRIMYMYNCSLIFESFFCVLSVFVFAEGQLSEWPFLAKCISFIEDQSTVKQTDMNLNKK